MTDLHEAPAVIPGSTEDELDRNYTPDYCTKFAPKWRAVPQLLGNPQR